MDAPLCLPFAIELLFFVWDFTFGLFYLAKRNMKVCSCVGPDYIGFPTHRRPYSNQIVKRISLRIHFAKNRRWSEDRGRFNEQKLFSSRFPIRTGERSEWRYRWWSISVRTDTGDVMHFHCSRWGPFKASDRDRGRLSRRWASRHCTPAGCYSS